MKRDQVEKRRVFSCGGFDGDSVCRGVIACQCCSNCLIHCQCTREAHVQRDAEMLAGEQMALARGRTWHG